MKGNVYRIEATRRRRTDEQQQRRVIADGLRNAARELRRVEELHDDRGGDRAS